MGQSIELLVKVVLDSNQKMRAGGHFLEQNSFGMTIKNARTLYQGTIIHLVASTSRNITKCYQNISKHSSQAKSIKLGIFNKLCTKLSLYSILIRCLCKSVTKISSAINSFYFEQQVFSDNYLLVVGVTVSLF